MRAYFDEQKGALGNRPATLSFRQIVIAPRPAPEAKARTKAQADSIVLELRRGADFATAAKRFSQDPGSKDQGGSLNWFRRGVMVPEFERVAFSLRPGVVSDPVESPFGYHIIQVERVQPGEVQARHILLIPTIDSVHVDSARALADSVRKLVLRGAPFDSLQRAFHDPSAEKQADNVPADKLPEAYAKAFGDADSGAVAAGVLPARRGHARAVRGRADHRTAPPGRYPLRGRARPDPRPARPAARHPALHRPAPERDLRGGPVIATRLAITLGDPRGIGPEITARALAEPIAAEITIVGAEDQIAAIPAARRIGVGTWGLGSGERAEDRARVIRAGRLAGHAVETAVKLALQGRGGRDRHRARAQARPPPGGLSLSRAHRVAGEAGRRRGRGDDARLARAARGAGDDPCAVPRCAGAPDRGPGDADRTHHAARRSATGSASRHRGSPSAP